MLLFVMWKLQICRWQGDRHSAEFAHYRKDYSQVEAFFIENIFVQISRFKELSVTKPFLMFIF